MIAWSWLACSSLLGSPAIPPVADPSPTPVRVVKTEKGFALDRAGSPFTIRGVGGFSYLEPLKARGGNSVRTWGSDDLEATLDRAHALGLTVTVGIWLGQPRQGFNYHDPASVRRQAEGVRNAVRRYRNHPAVLMWGLGNEMEGDGDDPEIWKAVNDLARIAREEDPNHPTMTVVAEVGGKKLENYRKYCPDVDILGINSYAGLASLPKRLKQAGYDRPWVVTEFGPPGSWEVAKTPWNAPIEPDSSAKAEMYLKDCEALNQANCLGGYAFLWGNKQEATATWFGLFLPSGESLGAVDSLTRSWTGQWPKNRAPRIARVESGAAGKQVAPGETMKANLVAEDPDGDPLTVRWEVRSESNDRRQGGDREAEPPAHPEAFVEARGMEFAFKTPAAEGAYRVFVYVYDGKGHAATANLPFFVKTSR